MEVTTGWEPLAARPSEFLSLYLPPSLREFLWKQAGNGLLNCSLNQKLLAPFHSWFLLHSEVGEQGTVFSSMYTHSYDRLGSKPVCLRGPSWRGQESPQWSSAGKMGGCVTGEDTEGQTHASGAKGPMITLFDCLERKLCQLRGYAQ